MVLERNYIIPLRKGFLKVPKYKRTSKAVKVARGFLMKHMKSKEVKLGRILNMKLHEHGRQNPPHKIEVKAVKDDEGIVKAELVGFVYEEKKVEEKKGLKERLLGGKKKKLEEEVKEAEKVEVAEEDKNEEEHIKKEEEEKKEILEKPAEKGKKPEVEQKDFGKKAGEKEHKKEVFSKTQKPYHEKKK